MVSVTTCNTRVRGRAGMIHSWQAIIDELCQRDALAQIGAVGALMDAQRQCGVPATDGEPEASGDR